MFLDFCRAVTGLVGDINDVTSDFAAIADVAIAWPVFPPDYAGVTPDELR